MWYSKLTSHKVRFFILYTEMCHPKKWFAKYFSVEICSKCVWQCSVCSCVSFMRNKHHVDSDSNTARNNNINNVRDCGDHFTAGLSSVCCCSWVQVLMYFTWVFPFYACGSGLRGSRALRRNLKGSINDVNHDKVVKCSVVRFMLKNTFFKSTLRW